MSQQELINIILVIVIVILILGVGLWFYNNARRP